MGSDWQVTLADTTRQPPAALIRGIQARLDAVDNQMSTWKPDSDLSRFNRAPAGSWHTLPAEFRRVLQAALQLAADSGGSYDPTVGKLVNLWGFGPAQGDHTPPPQAAIDAALAHTGWQKIRTDDQGRVLQPGDIALDLSSIAKGFAVDQVVDWLQSQGFGNFLVEVGGELAARGNKADGSPWRVAIEMPGKAVARAGTDDLSGITLDLHNQSVATSGNYRHAFVHAGRYYSHHIDPHSGWPVPHVIASVSVVADTTLAADPLGTLMMVLGPDAGMAYATQHDLAVLMLIDSGQGFEARPSPAFARRFLP